MLDLRTGTELWPTFGPMGSGENIRRQRFTIDIEDRADEQAWGAQLALDSQQGRV